MTEQEWRECSDPDALLKMLGDGACPRRLRLFSAACCRRVWHLLDEAAFREAVEAAEAFADGLASEEELDSVRCATFPQRARDGLSDDPLANAPFWAADAASQSAGDPDRAYAVASGAAWAVSWASELPADAALDHERAVQCDLLRCVFGNPLRPLLVAEEAWLRWNGGVVAVLALAILQSRRFEDMPVLADALEEAGCTDAELLNHLRGPGPHAHGCHVIDLLVSASGPSMGLATFEPQTIETWLDEGNGIASGYPITPGGRPGNGVGSEP